MAALGQSALDEIGQHFAPAGAGRTQNQVNEGFVRHAIFTTKNPDTPTRNPRPNKNPARKF